MDVTESRRVRTAMPVPLALVAAIGAALALVATYWDDSWHTDKGRDEFVIPPHLMLYGGVLLASLAVLTWGVGAWRSAGWGVRGVAEVLRDPALLLAGIGGTVTLASAPVDNAWHAAYGRDAVLWSPPHLTAVVGSLALSVGILAGLRNNHRAGAPAARLLTAAGVIGALQALVLEYDSDVPQFATVWFLPVAALGLCLAYAILDDLLPGRWAPAVAGVVYIGLRVVAVVLLTTLGFSSTLIPPVPLALLAVGALAPTSPGLRLVALGAMTPVIWWPFLQLQTDTTTVVPLSQLPTAIALGTVAGLAVAVAHGGLRRTPTTGAVLKAAVLLTIIGGAVVGMPDRAWAHDPGQGEQVRQGRLSVSRDSDRATLAVDLPGPCDDLVAVRTVARRAGRMLTGGLETEEQSSTTCAFTGSVRGLGAGRWFVYVELAGAGGRPLEMWLPVGPGSQHTEIRSLYAPPTSSSDGTRNVAGGGLLVVVVGLLVACLRLSRRAAASRSA